MVSFDPSDGVKRVVIEIGADTHFRPLGWYGLPGGQWEAMEIVAHQSFICAEYVAMVMRAKASEAAQDGD
jgi:hypothetical protein